MSTFNDHGQGTCHCAKLGDDVKQLLNSGNTFDGVTHWFTSAADNMAWADRAMGTTRLVDVATAVELDAHVDYYDRAAGDISQALEFVEDTGTEAAVALRATQRTMSSVATSLRRRAAELRGETSRVIVASVNPACEVCGGRGSVNHLLASPPQSLLPCRDCQPEVE